MRTISRVAFLLLSVFAVMVLLISRCAHEVEDTATTSGLIGATHLSKEYYLHLLQEQDQAHRREIDSLKAQIASLDVDLKLGRIGKMSRAVKNAVETVDEREIWRKEDDLSIYNSHINSKTKDRLDGFDNVMAKLISQKVSESEILHGVPLKTEYDIIPYDRFTLNRIYLAHPGLGKRVVERPIGYRKKDLNEVLLYALDLLNKDRKEKRYKAEHFVEGMYRIEPSMGTHYYFFFHDLDNPSARSYRRVVYTRPFAPLHVVENAVVDTQNRVVNIILPLSGRHNTFQQFMDHFTRVCIKNDKRVFLTVVYFGSGDQLEEVRTLINRVKVTYHFNDIMLLTLNETFSRGRGLHIGVRAWTRGDVLMFLCDVDIIFTGDFLERCRLNAESGVRVYYPIVFSLYNPNVVYSLQEQAIPPPEKLLVISKATGFWRDFGYGMTCQYRSDFLKVGGFEEKITGWGIEDVLLYRKYVKSNYMVIRATDQGIFHMWHEKHCDPNLSSEQYKYCIQSKALNEASHEHLGVLAFKDEINVHKSLMKNKKTEKNIAVG